MGAWLVNNQTERTTPRILIPFSLIHCFYWISILSPTQCNLKIVIVTFVNSNSNGIFLSELTFTTVILYTMLFESTRSMLCFDKELVRYYPFVCFHSIIDERSNRVVITVGFNYTFKKNRFVNQKQLWKVVLQQINLKTPYCLPLLRD